MNIIETRRPGNESKTSSRVIQLAVQSDLTARGLDEAESTDNVSRDTHRIPGRTQRSQTRPRTYIPFNNSRASVAGERRDKGVRFQGKQRSPVFRKSNDRLPGKLRNCHGAGKARFLEAFPGARPVSGIA